MLPSVFSPTAFIGDRILALPTFIDQIKKSSILASGDSIGLLQPCFEGAKLTPWL